MPECRKKPGSRWTHCRCERCHARQLAEAKRQSALPYHPANKAAFERVLHFLDRDWTPSALDQTLGTSVAIQLVMQRYRRGETADPAFHYATVRALQALPLSALPPPTAVRVRALSTTRRLQALAVMGYPPLWLADTAGATRGTLATIRYGRTEFTRGATLHAVKDVYDKWVLTPGPSERTAREARERGWAGPLCWEDDTINVAAARPQGQEVLDPWADELAEIETALQEGRTYRPVSPRGRLEMARLLSARGDSASAIAAHMGVTGRTADRLLARVGEVAA